jgi:hypothetical protein
MPKSKNRTEHKQKLNQFKQNQKMEQNKMEIPAVRNIPIWGNDTEIVMKGFEWEAIFNGLMGIQTAQQAANSVMTRNVLNGTINMDFEKFDKEKGAYVPMTPAEKEPYIADFEKAKQAAKGIGTEKVASAILNSDGLAQPAATDGKVEEPATGSEEAPQTAKIVQGDFK